MGAIAYAIQLLGIVPQLIAAGAQIKALINQGTASLTQMQTEKRDPTPAEWDALNVIIDALRAELHGRTLSPTPVPVPVITPAPLVYAEGFGPCRDNVYGPGGPFGRGCRIQ